MAVYYMTTDEHGVECVDRIVDLETVDLETLDFPERSPEWVAEVLAETYPETIYFVFPECYR